MLHELLNYKIAILAVWAALFFAIEILAPKAHSPFQGIARFKRWGRNFGLVGINFVISPLIVIPITLWASEAGFNWRGEFGTIFWDQTWTLLLDLLILDFFIYWWHRLNHVIPFLWRFHEVHHLDEFLDVTSATRFHFGEVILSALVRGGVILLMDIPLASVLIFETVVLICSIFHHSNIRISDQTDSVISKIFVTPNWHWMHHHAVRADTDSHYGNLLTIWDRLFRSRAKNNRTVDMKMGVSGRTERSFLGLIRRPIDKP
ncbi:sterol desaturase family protein [Curvivirga sp.]|uniref:sterol desaturase family protein n=1 Tax=Curvivirga sp. TaxID=2856848 RepID=UPI003B58F233